MTTWPVRRWEEIISNGTIRDYPTKMWQKKTPVVPEAIPVPADNQETPPFWRTNLRRPGDLRSCLASGINAECVSSSSRRRLACLATDDFTKRNELDEFERFFQGIFSTCNWPLPTLHNACPQFGWKWHAPGFI